MSHTKIIDQESATFRLQRFNLFRYINGRRKCILLRDLKSELYIWKLVFLYNIFDTGLNAIPFQRFICKIDRHLEIIRYDIPYLCQCRTCRIKDKFL